MKKALITGIAGQDGSFLAEFLLSKNYEVIGLAKKEFTTSENIENIQDKMKIINGDVADFDSVLKTVKDIKPDEIYNLAAQSFVADSWNNPSITAQCNALGPVNILESIKRESPNTKFFQASTCEIFGKPKDSPQTEETAIHPITPYGIAKLYAHLMVETYRKNYGVFASCGILFNHESERRGKQFVTRKISNSVASIKLGLLDHIELGNLNSQRDWGYAPDYVKGMYLMLQQEKSDDFILATGKPVKVRDFCNIAFLSAGIELEWEGSGLEEKGIDKKTGKTLVKVNPKFFRPTESNIYVGNPQKAETQLNWKREVSFEQMVEKMVQHDLELLKK